MRRREIIRLYEMLGKLVPRVSPDEIEAMDFLAFCAYIGDPNVAPGGWKTITQLVAAAGISSDDRVLDIGSNTGHSSIILHRASGAPVTGIDIRLDLVDLSRQVASDSGMDVTFGVADARCLPFHASAFSAVVSTGTMAFVTAQRDRMAAEMRRVITSGGVVADTCLFYRESPPPLIRERAAAILESPIPDWSVDDYIRLYTEQGLTLCAAIPVTTWNPHSSEDDRAAALDWITEREQALWASQGGEAEPRALTHLRQRAEDMFAAFGANDRYLDCRLLILRNEDR